MPTILTASRTVMHCECVDSERATYADADFTHTHVISYEKYVDMGHPETITVTVEPGDKLN